MYVCCEHVVHTTSVQVSLVYTLHCYLILNFGEFVRREATAIVYEISSFQVYSLFYVLHLHPILI